MKEKDFTFDRRRFLQASAMAAGAFAIAPLPTACTTVSTKEVNRSDFGGVKMGAITYSYRSLPGGAGNTLLYVLGSGIGSIELMGDVAESYAGRPAAPQFGPATRPTPGQVLTREQQAERDAMMAARQKYNEDVLAWRLSVPMAKYEELAKIYKMAGIDIHIIKLEPNMNMTDAELEYVFKVCTAVGAMGVTVELNLPLAERVQPFAAKYGKYVIFHNHQQFSQENFEGYDVYLKYENARFNFDMGHYYGSTGKDPREIVEKYHDRIAAIHVKDKTGPGPDGDGKLRSPYYENRMWGQGETPLKEFLLFIQSNAGKPGWPVHCDIELEYAIPENSNAVAETARCVEWARNVLVK
ncbi:MAG: sugar phosphate isomerase/epimerase [Tannerella sp.]|jgi:sugar phosphate isomerase/epimerase|nr:sugar phosphate isomerase/epimerase [Tannerella sp.]